MVSFKTQLVFAYLPIGRSRGGDIFDCKDCQKTLSLEKEIDEQREVAKNTRTIFFGCPPYLVCKHVPHLSCLVQDCVAEADTGISGQINIARKSSYEGQIWSISTV